MPSDPVDNQMAGQLERIIRRVKQSMNYRGSYSTRDILGSLVTRWVDSGEWQRLKELPVEERRVGESVRRFILDRFAQLRRRGYREELEADKLRLPDEPSLVEMAELAELRRWLAVHIAKLARGAIDPRVRIPLARPALVGAALVRHLEGKTQREIAAAMSMSLGAVNKLLAEGLNYLVVLHGIEQRASTT